METNNNTPTVNYAYSALYLDQNCKWQRIPAIGLGYATKRDLWAALYKAAADIDIPCQSIKITTTRYYK